MIRPYFSWLSAIVCAAGLSLATVFADESNQPNLGPPVNGKCVDSGGELLSGVEIITTKGFAGTGMRGRQVFSADENGEFSLAGLYSQPADVEDEYVAIAVDHKRKLACQFNIARKNTKGSLTVVLQPMQSVKGRVVSTNGDPIKGATVKLGADWFNNRSINQGPNSTKDTDAEGYYQFDCLIPGVRHHVQAVHPDYKDDRSLTMVQESNGKCSVPDHDISPVVSFVKPELPDTRKLDADKAFAILSKGLPGKYTKDYGADYEQYLLDVETWARALRELAKRDPGTEVALKCCLRMLDPPSPYRANGHAVRSLQRQATEIVLNDYIDREELGPYVSKLVRSDNKKMVDVAERLIKNSKHDAVLGPALWLLSLNTSHDDLDRLRKVRDDYGEIQMWGSTLGELAESALRIKLYYSVGKTPQDIVGKTLDGKTLRLSDFRGKVVVIWFWAKWSTGENGVLEQMEKLNRMSRTLKDKPFQVLGVSMDDPETSRSLIEKAGTTWPSWHEGNFGKGSNNKWGVKGNKLLLLDHNGVLIQKGVSQFQLSGWVSQALKQAMKEE